MLSDHSGTIMAKIMNNYSEIIKQADETELCKALREELSSELVRSLDELSIDDPLLAAVKHALLPPGKCIRPLFALLLCNDLGGDFKRFMPVSVALELIHVSSLIHDDLPAVDNDDLRRGRATCHKAFGEATAIFAGDLLVAHALRTTLKAEHDFGAEVAVKLCTVLSEAFIELCHGQQLDLLPHADEESLARVHNKKTGALFKATAFFGAIGGQGNTVVQEAAAELGYALGYYFQIADDFIDRFGSDEQRGRSGSSDTRNAKETSFSGNFDSGKSLIKQEKSIIFSAFEKLADSAGKPASAFPGTAYIIKLVLARGEF